MPRLSCSPSPFPLSLSSHPVLFSFLPSFAHHCCCCTQTEFFWPVTGPGMPYQATSPPVNNQELLPFSLASTFWGIVFVSPSSHVSSPRVSSEGGKDSSFNWVESSTEPSNPHPIPPLSLLTAAGSSGQTSQSSLRQGTPVTCVNSALLPSGN